MNLLWLMQVAVLPALCIAVLLTFVRVWRGPSLADRVVALDLMVMLAIGILAAVAVTSGQPSLLDVGLVLGLVSFLGTVAFAHYIGGESQ